MTWHWRWFGVEKSSATAPRGTGANAKVNVSRQAINAVETGKFDPSLWLAYDIAQLFNKSIEEVFDFKESERK